MRLDVYLRDLRVFSFIIYSAFKDLTNNVPQSNKYLTYIVSIIAKFFDEIVPITISILVKLFPYYSWI